MQALFTTFFILFLSFFTCHIESPEHILIWKCIRYILKYSNISETKKHSVRSAKSGKRDSNSRPSPWQGDALPLSHFRTLFQASLLTALQRYLSYHCFINNASLFYNFFHFIFHVHHSFIIPYKNCSYCMTFTLFLPKNRVS